MNKDTKRTISIYVPTYIQDNESKVTPFEWLICQMDEFVRSSRGMMQKYIYGGSITYRLSDPSDPVEFVELKLDKNKLIKKKHEVTLTFTDYPWRDTYKYAPEDTERILGRAVGNLTFHLSKVELNVNTYRKYVMDSYKANDQLSCDVLNHFFAVYVAVLHMFIEAHPNVDILALRNWQTCGENVSKQQITIPY